MRGGLFFLKVSHYTILMPKLIIANWKMNPATEAEAVALAEQSDFDNVVLCPPFPFLEAVRAVVKKAKLGAQDFFWKNPIGPYTGEVSAAELKGLGVEYAIIGHSERRLNLGETDEMVARKMATAVKEGLIPILCVGETAEQKEGGDRDQVLKQEVAVGLSQTLVAINPERYLIYIAYEPIWAISTSESAQPDNPEDTVSAVNFIKQVLTEIKSGFNIKFLYGGSVNWRNADGYLEKPEIEGLLVGGASLVPEEIKKISGYAKEY